MLQFVVCGAVFNFLRSTLFASCVYIPFCSNNQCFVFQFLSSLNRIYPTEIFDSQIYYLSCYYFESLSCTIRILQLKTFGCLDILLFCTEARFQLPPSFPSVYYLYYCLFVLLRPLTSFIHIPFLSDLEERGCTTECSV
jgi:hypothetical protein